MAKHKGGRAGKKARDAAREADGVYVSGRLVILSIVAVALAAAGFSWWYRYTATRRAAQFWGPQAVRLIRDAPTVQLVTIGPLEDGADHVHRPGNAFPDHYHAAGRVWTVIDRRDVSKAPGLSHLRNELLLDRNLTSVGREEAIGQSWRTGLEFHDPPAPPLVVLFSSDCSVLLGHTPSLGDERVGRVDPIAAGLQKVFGEWRQAGPR